MNYYNEWDKGAAAWLRELIKQGHIPFGVVDERSITEVKPEDLDGFTQCHFFAGIGGWPLALRLAGVSEDTPLWTGSPPCQPFSTAGKQLGQFDPRHLAPVFLDLISECRPPVIFGEQVAAAIAKSWMCDLQAHLEGEDYAVGFAVLPACSVGAPHKRERLFFGAHELAYTDSERLQRERRDSDSHGREGQNIRQAGLLNRAGIESESTNPHHGFWSDADWLGCRDGKFRPVEPGAFPLANGIPARVGRLRGYGNAIVPQVAAEFIKAFMGAVNE
ncbi:TPA: DNA cytosine methyltransferase [Escherichia coli]|nr:DNA cytosine methyltransferase [Escherichia coli]HDC2741922.1 DNA cytosine methyltransferase [Escherichia coli]